MELSEARALLGQHWSAFVGAVFDPTVRPTPGGAQMYVWQSLNTFYLSRGEPLPTGPFLPVNPLLSVPSTHARHAATHGPARPTSQPPGPAPARGADHLSPSANARRPQEHPRGRQSRATRASLWPVDGEPMTMSRSHEFGYDLPQSMIS